MQYPESFPGRQPRPSYGLTQDARHGGIDVGGLSPYPSQAAMPSRQELADALGVPEHLAPAYGVSLVEAYQRYLKRAFTFKGYASRSELWWVALVNSLIGATIMVPMGALFAAGNGTGSDTETAGLALAALLLVFATAVSVPNVALFVRRMHDTGRSGRWLLLVLVPMGRIALIILACMESRPDLWRPEWSR